MKSVSEKDPANMSAGKAQRLRKKCKCTIFLASKNALHRISGEYHEIGLHILVDGDNFDLVSTVLELRVQLQNIAEEGAARATFRPIIHKQKHNN